RRQPRKFRKDHGFVGLGSLANGGLTHKQASADSKQDSWERAGGLLEHFMSAKPSASRQPKLTRGRGKRRPRSDRMSAGALMAIATRPSPSDSAMRARASVNPRPRRQELISHTHRRYTLAG